MSVSRFAILLACCAAWSNAQVGYAPLFVIERNLNANIVHYDARLKDGKLDPQQPIVVYWELKAEGGSRRDLNLIERMRAYGFSVRAGNQPDTYILNIVSDKKRRMEIRVHHVGPRVRAEVKLGVCQAYLDKIYVKAHKALILPVADSVELFGTEIATGKPCQAVIRDN